MSQLTRFSYQQLQYCPQRNVSSISKQKHFNSTVSKYDPRTKRTTRIINCVPYDQLIAKDMSKCCFPEPVPPVQIIYITINTYGVIPSLFSVTLAGTGHFIYGNDVVERSFATSTPRLFQFNPVYDPENTAPTTISIHTSDITYLDLSGNAAFPIVSLNISAARTLQTFICRSNQTINNFNITGNINLRRLELVDVNLYGVEYFDSCPNITYIDIRSNIIYSGIAEDMVRRLVSNGTPNGTLLIEFQFIGNVNINTPIFNTLRNTLGWTIG